ncbi:glycosyltransferase [Beijerinckia sp. L45]|uniref:glycosyltransferase n=1 Tax=Beijerinckia sp. L45 TaxID=1641855 RepID=UPI00131D92BE|nr:glycosyltransferase [Beijerinckia sp. L45]
MDQHIERDKNLFVEFVFHTTVCPCELAPTSDVRNLAIGFKSIDMIDTEDGRIIREFDFRDFSTSRPEFIYGMCYPESWGTWSSGRRSALYLTVPESEDNITLRVHHHTIGDLEIEADAFINGVATGTVTFNGQLVDIAFSLKPLDMTSDPQDFGDLKAIDPREAKYADVSVVITNLNRPDLVFLCVKSLLRSYTSYTIEILVIENGSSSDSVSILKSYSLPIKIIEFKHAISFGSANNIAVEYTCGKSILFLNNDAFINEDVIDLLIDRLQDGVSGSVGPSFKYPDGRMQELGGSINVDGSTTARVTNCCGILSDTRNVDYVSGACLAVGRNDFVSVGGFDPAYKFAYFEDVDLAMRLRACGKSIRLVKEAVVWHIKNSTSLNVDLRDATLLAIKINQETFRSRWRDWLISRHPKDLLKIQYLEEDFINNRRLSLLNSTCSCVSHLGPVTFDVGQYSFLSIVASLSLDSPTIISTSHHFSLISLHNFFEQNSIQFGSEILREVPSRDSDIDVHVVSSRLFPSVAPPQGRVRILHCSTPILVSGDREELQRRIGGLLNFDAIVVDTESSRLSCLNILKGLDAPCPPIHVISPPSLAPPIVERENLIVCIGTFFDNVTLKEFYCLMSSLRKVKSRIKQDNWNIIFTGDLDASVYEQFSLLESSASYQNIDILINLGSSHTAALLARAKICIVVSALDIKNSDEHQRPADGLGMSLALVSGCTIIMAHEIAITEKIDPSLSTFFFNHLNDLSFMIGEAMKYHSTNKCNFSPSPGLAHRDYHIKWAQVIEDVKTENEKSKSNFVPALVVIGMHRSGTSAMARVLSLAGAELPNDLMPPKADNPSGFWEPLDISEFNERLLGRYGSKWHDVLSHRLRETGLIPENLRQEASLYIRSNYSGTRSIVLKDPRISRFVMDWDLLLRSENYNPTYIIMVRSPIEVAESLKKRNNLSISHGILLWANYMTQALKSTKSLERALVSYTRLVEDPTGTLGELVKQTKLRLPRYVAVSSDITSFISPMQRHHWESNTPLPQELYPVQKLYDAILDIENDTTQLDQVATEVESWLDSLEMPTKYNAIVPGQSGTVITQKNI